jgi:transposase
VLDAQQLLKENQELRRQLEVQGGQLEAERALTARLTAEVAQLKEETRLQRDKIDLLIRKIFGASSEKIDPRQMELLLFGAAGAAKEQEAPPLPANILAMPMVGGPVRKQKTRRPRLPETLPVVETVIDPVEVKAEPEAWRHVGEEVSDQLDVIPPRFIRSRTVRRKFVRRDHPFQAPVIAPLPAKLLERGGFTAGTIAYFVVGKFCDHLPGYRQSAICGRYGVEVSRQSIVRSIHLAAEWLKPVVEVMKEEMFRGSYVQIDETPVRYLKPGLGRAPQGYFWAFHVPGGDSLYHWRASRGHEVLLEVIPESFTGSIQCDGYSAYKAFGQIRGNPLGGCWSHARRKFYEALEAGDSVCRMAWILRQIAHLFAVEALITDKSPRIREAVRASHSRMIIARIGRALERFERSGLHLPQSPAAKAIGYCRNQWAELCAFLENGEMEISTNLAENAIRPTAVGKKNWLFVGGEDKGWASAVLYTILQSCRNRGVDPYEYLKHALTRLPEMTNHQLPTITPRAFAEMKIAQGRVIKAAA